MNQPNKWDLPQSDRLQEKKSQPYLLLALLLHLTNTPKAFEKKTRKKSKAVDLKMQAAGSVCFSASFLPLKNTKSLLMPRSVFSFKPNIKRAKPVLMAAGGDGGSVDATAAAAVESVVDYSSLGSVFPAEACETVGGEACDVAIYPEAKLTASTNTAEAPKAVEEVERDYLEYNQQKTVFPGEACDDLGGEFCEPEYQIGVGKEKASA
ncbi:hypothetical protein M5K25_004929 [Dendrobium thyrsiflorum]|uniref:Light-regulated protein n=1 Tax=Dendrobium thyrsiflorum TaxID=117978 RepID=A0ABD0VGK4_DENTH